MPALLRLLMLLCVATAGPVSAYVGPGAGLAVVGTAWIAVILVLALATVAVFPVYGLYTWVRQLHRRSQARTRRVVVIGLDGLDPGLAEQWMTSGDLPNLRRLAHTGGFRRLGTTLPPLTPAAWSSFSTGVDPSRHGIFDFVTRDPRTYKPTLSSVDISRRRRSFGVGRWRLSWDRPSLRSRRRSELFWHYLGRAGVPSSIIRMPITFPAEPFPGVLLSGMCAPDLRGTQGESTLFTSNGVKDRTPRGRVASGRLEQGAAPRGRVVAVSLEGGCCHTHLPGPGGLVADGEELATPLRIDVRPAGVLLTLESRQVHVDQGEYSPWTDVVFRAGRRRFRGLCRFYLTDTDPLTLNATPIQNDPQHPLMPLSHPPEFARYLGRRLGPFATLGLAEDTDALDDGVIDEEAFLRQAWDIHEERERMLFHELERNRHGLVACVFDGTDRIQHMFYRDLDADHPAADSRPGAANAIADIYRKADDLVGRVRTQLEEVGDDAVLVVLSDHGFCDFRRGVDLNAWLQRHGYLHTLEGQTGGEWLSVVDWTRTTAYAMGLCGIYLNQAGREAHGIVPEEQAPTLRQELVEALSGLVDPETGDTAIRRVWDSYQRFTGPYIDAGPDLFVGYDRGYRVSWTCARGQIGTDVFEDNSRRWSGDHSGDPAVVPGALWCSRPLAVDAPHLIDMAPTIMNLFGVTPPAHMRGRDLCAAVDVPGEVDG